MTTSAQQAVPQKTLAQLPGTAALHDQPGVRDAPEQLAELRVDLDAQESRARRYRAQDCPRRAAGAAPSSTTVRLTRPSASPTMRRSRKRELG